MTENPIKPYALRDTGGCTCCYDPGDGSWAFAMSPDCRYHRMAAEQPWNHRIPWNCPTYWDGCNCEGGPFYDPPDERSDLSRG